MKTLSADIQVRVRQNWFSASPFGAFFVILLLMSGIHTGLIVLVNEMNYNKVVQILVPLIYWGLVAAVLTILFIAAKKEKYHY